MVCRTITLWNSDKAWHHRRTARLLHQTLPNCNHNRQQRPLTTNRIRCYLHSSSSHNFQIVWTFCKTIRRRSRLPQTQIVTARLQRHMLTKTNRLCRNCATHLLITWLRAWASSNFNSSRQGSNSNEHNDTLLLHRHSLSSWIARLVSSRMNSSVRQCLRSLLTNFTFKIRNSSSISVTVSS